MRSSLVVAVSLHIHRRTPLFHLGLSVRCVDSNLKIRRIIIYLWSSWIDIYACTFTVYRVLCFRLCMQYSKLVGSPKILTSASCCVAAVSAALHTWQRAQKKKKIPRWSSRICIAACSSPIHWNHVGPHPIKTCKAHCYQAIRKETSSPPFFKEHWRARAIHTWSYEMYCMYVLTS